MFTDRSFVDDLLLSQSEDHGAIVDEILYDRWAAVVVEAGALGDELQIVVQCDKVTLGLAAIWEWLERRARQSTDE